MKIIKIKNQTELDALPDSFDDYTKIEIVGKIERITKNYKNAFIEASDNAVIESAYGNAVIEYAHGNAVIESAYENAVIKYASYNAVIESAYENAVIEYAYGNAVIKSAYGNAVIKSAYGNAVIESVSDNAVIKHAYGNAVIEYAHGNAVIKSAYGNAVIKFVFDNAVIEYAYDNAVIKSAHGNAVIKSVFGNAVIKSASGNAVIKIFSENVKILSAKKYVVLIYQNCSGSPSEKDKTVSICRTENATFDLDDFIKIYNVKKIGSKLILYKSVRDDLTDFKTGKIKYIGTVVCPDWDANINRECGGGLHLSPSIRFCKNFNSGRYLKCEVDIKDILVHPNPEFPYKVRCRLVKVLEEVFDD